MSPGRAQAGERVDQHREEGHDDDDGGLRLPVEAEPHHHDRRDADDGHGADQRAERQQPALQERAAVDQHGGDEAERAAQRRSRPAPSSARSGGSRRQSMAEMPASTCADRARGGQQHRGTREADDEHLPEIEQPGAEQAAGRAACRPRRARTRGQDLERAPGEADASRRARSSQKPGASETEGQAPTRAGASGGSGRRTAARRGEREARPRKGRRLRTRRCGGTPASAASGSERPALAEPVSGGRRYRAARPAAPGRASVSSSAAARPVARHHALPPIRRKVRRSARPTSADQDQAEQRRHHQRRPDLHRLAVIGAGQQARAEAGLRAGRQLADDRADQADGDARPSATGTGTAARPASAASRRSAPGDAAVGAHQVELQRVGRAQALDHADRDREEAEIHRDDRLRA